MLSDFEFIDPFPKTFQILQYKVDLPHEEIAQWCRDMLAGFNGDYTSYFFQELNDHKLRNRAPWYRDLEKIMIEGSHMFLDNIGAEYDKKRSRVGAWWSVYKQGDRHQMHNHPKSLVAGTYYPHASEKSSKIRYRSPCYSLLTMCETRPDIHNLYDVKPETGMINFWSPWLDHEVLPQGPVEEGDERVAISFNYSGAV